jgi:Uma2 family endonuclease
LHNVRWKTYEELAADSRDNASPRLTYDRGTLEIVSPSSEHEESNSAIEAIIQVVAEEWDIDFRNLGSTTFKREDLERGFEPDACFYVQNVDRIRGQRDIDLALDPAPDLVVEIDITNPSLEKMPIFARLGIPEVWRYQRAVLTILVLDQGAYHEQEASRAFPLLTRTVLNDFLAQSHRQRRPNWLRGIRAWARQQVADPGA